MGVLFFPRFNDLFPNSKEDNLKDLLSKVSSEEILKYLSKINQDIYLERTNSNIDRKIIADLCYNLNEFDKKTILQNYDDFVNKKRNYDHKIILFSEMIILNLMIEVLKNVNTLKSRDSNKETLSIVLIKSLLISNDVYDKKQVEQLGDGINQKKSFLINIQQNGYSTPRNVGFILMLSFEFFSFLESNSKLKPFLDEFLDKMKINDFRVYIATILSFFLETLNTNKNTFKLHKAYEPIAEGIINYLCFDLTNEKLLNGLVDDKKYIDYKLIREKPLLKIKNNEYCILDNNFLLDKLYIGLIFDFYHNTSLINRKDLYRDFGDFQGFLGLEFAEKKPFYKFVDNCFLDEKKVSIFGDSFKEEEYSDYYVREGNNLFLFEFKNYIIDAITKNSFDYDKITEKIKQKLYEKEKRNKNGKISIKDVGIKQLINTIKKINEGGYSFDKLDTDIDDTLYIYPILVYTDDFFNVKGMHTIVDGYYENELAKLSKTDCQINRLILISLNDLMRIGYTIFKTRVRLNYLLDYYNEAIKDTKTKALEEGKLFIIPHFIEVINNQLVEMDIEEISHITSSILGNYNHILLGFMYDHSNRDLTE